MKIIGINTSPRNRANTQTLVEAALEGAAEKDAETRLVNLRELTVHGCMEMSRCQILKRYWTWMRQPRLR